MKNMNLKDNKIFMRFTFIFVLMMCLFGNIHETYGEGLYNHDNLNDLPVINTENETKMEKNDIEEEGINDVIKGLFKEDIVKIVLVVIFIIILFCLIYFTMKKKNRISVSRPVLEDDDISISLTKIVLHDINHKDKKYGAVTQGIISIGRTEDNNIVIPYDETISSKHCEIIKKGNCFYLKDNNSKNGTYYDGERIMSETPIIGGKILKIGKQSFVIEFFK